MINNDKLEDTYIRLINLLISSNPSKKGFKSKHSNELGVCVFTIIGKGWDNNIPNDDIINKVNSIKPWNYNEIIDLPTFINKRIADMENFVNKDNSNAIGVKQFRQNIDDFANKFSEDVRAAIIQRNINNIINKHINYTYSSLNEIRNGIYTSLIAILGIFAAIMMSAFGGLKLLNELFTNIGGLSHIGIGKVISVSAIFLFGIYSILFLLFNGTSALINGHYIKHSIGLNIYLISDFIIIFLLGYVYSDVKNIHAYHAWVLVAIFIIVFIIIALNVIIWKFPYIKLWKRCHKMHRNKNK